MECRDRVRERFLRALQLSGALGLARARRRRAGVRTGVPSVIAATEFGSLVSFIRHMRRLARAGFCHRLPNAALAASVLRFRCERSERILGEKRPRAFAFLPHDRGPILGCRIEGVDIHELDVGVIEGEIDRVGGFVEGAETYYCRGAPTKDIEPMQNVA